MIRASDSSSVPWLASAEQVRYPGSVEPDNPVTVTDAELELIDEGQEAADRGDLIDAGAFLAELRREG